MNYPSIEIQGSVISTDILSKIRSEQVTYQQGKDFNSEFTNSKLKDEISFVWQEAKGQWIIFRSKLARLKTGQTGTTETRNFWIQPLLTNLGYNLTYSKSSEEVNGKQFPIGFKDNNLCGFPVYVGSFLDSLDKPPQSRLLKYSPHAMLQEYLNYSEEQNYGLVTNGRQIRLLRDATRITRLSYIEFNLEKMMEEDLYSDFVILYRLLHASRVKKQFDGAVENIIEKYHQESLEAGSTIRSKLGFAVRQAIETLGQEFINHPNNIFLREAIKDGKVNPDDFYRHLLRIIYRLLFLFVIEERNLVFGESKTPELKRFNHIYFNYYSLIRLRKLAKYLPPPEANRHYDLWLSLMNTFSLFENKEIGVKLGIMSLEGDLFSYDAISSSSYDLHQCYISNLVILKIVKSLTYFENDNRVLIPVNYGGLDVEEFGSVYEGLLELKLSIKKIEGSDTYSCSFESSSERSQSGSHYTPEELVQPLIKHSLEYLIEERVQPYYQRKAEKEKALQSLLNLKVCDVACGSGHILLSAARRIALEYARIITGEEQPNPTATRKAMRLVVRNCIYGVDKNPLAVELCKVALWLEAHNPGEPLSFLDHHIKCGDSIVGLAHREELQHGISDEAFKTLPGDDKIIAKRYKDKNVIERKTKQIELDFSEKLSVEVLALIEKYNLFKNLPERSPEEVDSKRKQFRNYEGSVEHLRLKQLADAQIAQFFIPKTDLTKHNLITNSDFYDYLGNVSRGLGEIQDRRLAYATVLAKEKSFFHWFLEFPEVMLEGGFDCILGNPPYMSGTRISTNFSHNYLLLLHTLYFPAKGRCDLVGYFFRRIDNIVNQNGFYSLISTNTITQADTREGSIDILYSKGAEIIFALTSINWPGAAAVVVSLLSFSKKKLSIKKVLNRKEVNSISPFLSDDTLFLKPFPLLKNENLCEIGSYILGDGFFISESQKLEFIKANEKNKEVIFPIINGSDLNNSYDQSASRFIINFFNWEKEYCEINYKECFKHLTQTVYYERMDGNNVEAKKTWWQYWRSRIQHYQRISKLRRIIAQTVVTKTHSMQFLPSNYVYSSALAVIALEDAKYLSILQSTIHESWSWKYASTMKGDRRYNPTDCFQTYPMPNFYEKDTESELDKIGEQYHEFRSHLMLDMQLGLTKLYNIFHNAECRSDNLELAKNIREFKQANLQIPVEQAIQRIEKLRALHKQMDKAVLKAYGWTDINLAHNFYEVDYLPENDRVRYTISPEARKEILKRLLDLNHNIHAEEVAAGLWDKKTKKKEKSLLVKETKIDYGQGEMFGE